MITGNTDTSTDLETVPSGEETSSDGGMDENFSRSEIPPEW